MTLYGSKDPDYDSELGDDIPNINQMQLSTLVAMWRIEHDLRAVAIEPRVRVAPPFTRVRTG